MTPAAGLALARSLAPMVAVLAGLGLGLLFVLPRAALVPPPVTGFAAAQPASAPASPARAVATVPPGTGRVEAGRSGPIRLVDVEGIPVNASIAPGVSAMLTDAAAAGLDLGGSGWRSHQRQIELYAQNCRAGRCSPPTARPGTSEHEDGLAVDLTCAGTLIRSRTSPCFVWLRDHAGTYGLFNLPSEPWHWSHDGT